MVCVYKYLCTVGILRLSTKDEGDRAAIHFQTAREDVPTGGIVGHWWLDGDVFRGHIGNGIEGEQTGQEISSLVGQGTWLMMSGALEMQLQRVDPFEAQLRRTNRAQVIWPLQLGQSIKERNVIRLE